MATTDAKAGFRLPWSSDRSESGAANDGTADAPESTSGDPVDPTTQEQELETPAMIDAAPAATSPEAAVDAHGADPLTAGSVAPTDPLPAAPTDPVPATPAAPATPAPTVARKPNKFMADLARAMQVAAESARTDSMDRLTAEAKAYIETIHADSTTEATELRKRADDDVASVREWSKAEIARIREETDERIGHRKGRLEREIEDHAAEVEARVGRVQQRVAGFEAEMADFFERLLAEPDPTHFAAMAESLPEPPPFDGDDDWTAPVAVAVVEPVVETTAEVEIASEATSEPTIEAATTTWQPVSVVDLPPASTEDGSADLFSIGTDAPDDDPRLSALRLSPDFAAAEAEAEAAARTPEQDGPEESAPEIADDAIATRLEGLLPQAGASDEVTTTTRLVVTGLISVASIAGFKRHLARAVGIHSVGVSSGPDGEFVFAVNHDASVALRDVVPTLQGFAARVTSDGNGELSVTAHDPESEN